jgi:hypothetical protein
MTEFNQLINLLEKKGKTEKKRDYRDTIGFSSVFGFCLSTLPFR